MKTELFKIAQDLEQGTITADAIRRQGLRCTPFQPCTNDEQMHTASICSKAPAFVQRMLQGVFNSDMEIQIDRNEERLEVKKIMIFTQNKEFTIYIDKFGELIVNKEQYGNEESGIVVRPKVSNEIGLY